MKINKMKQRVMQACLVVALTVGTTARAELSFDHVDRHVTQELTKRDTDPVCKDLLHKYMTQSKAIRHFLRQFLNKNLNGSTQVFTHDLEARLAHFKETVIDPMGRHTHLAQIHAELNELYKEFLKFKALLHANKDTKSAYALGLKFAGFTHLVPGDIKAEYSAKAVIDGLTHRLRCTGDNIGMTNA